MKLFTLIAMMTFAFYAFPSNASDNAELLYDALIADEIDVTNGRLGAMTLEKSVAGLTCSKSTVVYPGAKPSYSCRFSANINHELLYKALDTREEDITDGRLGATTIEKSVGGLTCSKSTVVYPGAKPSYSCELSN